MTRMIALGVTQSSLVMQTTVREVLSSRLSLMDVIHEVR